MTKTRENEMNHLVSVALMNIFCCCCFFLLVFFVSVDLKREKNVQFHFKSLSWSRTDGEFANRLDFNSFFRDHIDFSSLIRINSIRHFKAWSRLELWLVCVFFLCTAMYEVITFILWFCMLLIQTMTQSNITIYMLHIITADCERENM